MYDEQDLKEAAKAARETCDEATYREFYLALRERILSDTAAWYAGWEDIFNEVLDSFECVCEPVNDFDTDLVDFYETWYNLVPAEAGEASLYGPNYGTTQLTYF